jgi:hypothetical protein
VDAGTLPDPMLSCRKRSNDARSVSVSCEDILCRVACPSVGYSTVQYFRWDPHSLAHRVPSRCSTTFHPVSRAPAGLDRSVRSGQSRHASVPVRACGTEYGVRSTEYAEPVLRFPTDQHRRPG